MKDYQPLSQDPGKAERSGSDVLEAQHEFDGKTEVHTDADKLMEMSSGGLRS